MNLLDRRLFLTGMAATTVATLLPDAANTDPAPFPFGVASGDPDHSSVVLWTRLTHPATVTWEVAHDEHFTRIVRKGQTTARPESANSVHVIADQLTPDRWYHYRFTADGVASRVGRTRTLPAPGADQGALRFAIASCQAWAGGPYPAYRDMAQQDLDFVLHLGDYIYETADGSLTEFRRLHELYKTSEDLREAHARFPFFTTWDDHEVLNNWAAAHKPNPDGRPFEERIRDAFQAYYEHLPTRTAPNGASWPIYRRFRWGKLAEFSVLDTRQYRDPQACGDALILPPCDEVYDPARTMMGPEQETWLLKGLRHTTARWNVIAQQTILAAFDYDLGPGQAYNLDQWDGYPAARKRILDTIEKHRPRNPIILSGDWHSHWVNDIKADFEDPTSPTIATEFVGTSISSGIGWDTAVRQGLPANPHVKLYNGTYRGYVICEAGRETWHSTLRIITEAGPKTLAVFEVRDGTPGATQISAGDGISGKITNEDGPLPNAEVVLTGAVTSRMWTDATGTYLAFVPPGTYTLEAHAVGYESTSRQVTVGTGELVDVTLTRTTAPFAGTGRRVPGQYAEAGPADVVLGNEKLSMAVAVAFADPQLPGATKGKPVDLAATGKLDQLDWLNLPYVSPTRPTGTEAWQQGLLISTEVTVEGTTIQTSGTTGDLTVTTTYEVAANTPWVTATSVFKNTTATPVTKWIGDAIDHDGPGQRSGVPGHGTITTPYGNPAAYTPTAPWIGMTGSDAQTYALVYDKTTFTAYGTGNWMSTQQEVTIHPGEEWTLKRRIVAIPTEADPWAPLEGI